MKTKTTAMKTAKSAAVKKTLIALAVALMCFGAYFLCMTAAVRNTGAQSTPNWNNETGVFTYTNDTSDSSWRNASIPLPSNLYGMFAYDNSTLSVADLTGVKGLLLNAQNDGIAYAWELGIEDMRYTSARMGNSNYQWQSTSGNGSGIFLPDSGTPYYANVNTIPAGFHGQIFIPFQAL
ncbi:MAG: hypothetical protein LBL66_08695, partial [Clostridiales bacterium]|nr:hypothetical protein [Clostridiales bacterium]